MQYIIRETINKFHILEIDDTINVESLIRLANKYKERYEDTIEIIDMLCEKLHINYEIKKEGKSYTYQTIEHFNSEDQELYFIVGGDMLNDFKTWKNPQRIFR